MVIGKSTQSRGDGGSASRASADTGFPVPRPKESWGQAESSHSAGVMTGPLCFGPPRTPSQAQREWAHGREGRLEKKIFLKTPKSSCRGSVEMNLSIPEEAGSIPGLTQWVKDRRCCEPWCRSQSGLDPALLWLWGRPAATADWTDP